MNPQQQAANLIENLQIDPKLKEQLSLDLENNGIGFELIGKIEKALSQVEEDFLARAAEQAEVFKRELEASTDQLKQIAKEQKQNQKIKNQQQDDQDLREVRDRFSSVN